MKKLLLFLLVLAGGVSTASAASNAYLLCEYQTNKWNTSDTSIPFYKIDDDHFRIILNETWVSTDFYCRFVVDGTQWGTWTTGSTNVDLSGGGYGAKNYDLDTSCSFKISKIDDPTSKLTYIEIYYYDSKWNIRYYSYDAENYTVSFVKPDNWGTPNIYVWDQDRVALCGSWAGTAMSNNGDGTYSYTVKATDSSKVIFNDGSNQTSNAGFSLVNDAVYNTSGQVSTESVPVNLYGMATFCSQYPLDFSTATPSGLKAYKITASNKATGELTKEEVTKVPAGVGVYLEGASTDYTVNCTATATSIGDNMLVGVTADTPILQTVDDNTNYILTVNKDGGDVGTPKFFKVNTAGNTVGANKAYLQIPTANAAREYFWFDDEATGINAAKVSQPAGVIFDLQGRRVAQPTKGLYIVNGKKYFAK